MPPTPQETEIKLPLPDPEGLRARLRGLGLALAHARTFEVNVLFDTNDASLRGRGVLLRVRQFGERWTLTYKGPGQAGRHKVREELEMALQEPEAFLAILDRLGFHRSFRYEKYRTEYYDSEGVLTIDETPIGNFLELEGTPAWIDRTAALLGYGEPDYITKSYGRLYLEHCAREGREPADMVFSGRPETEAGKIP